MKHLVISLVASSLAVLSLSSCNSNKWMEGWWESPETFWYFGEDINKIYFIDDGTITAFEYWFPTGTEIFPKEKTESLPFDIAVDNKARTLSTPKGELRKVSVDSIGFSSYLEMGQPTETCPDWIDGYWSFEDEGGLRIFSIKDGMIAEATVVYPKYADDFYPYENYTYEHKGRFGYLMTDNGNRIKFVLNFINKTLDHCGEVDKIDLEISTKTRKEALWDWLQGKWEGENSPFSIYIYENSFSMYVSGVPFYSGTVVLMDNGHIYLRMDTNNDGLKFYVDMQGDYLSRKFGSEKETVYFKNYSTQHEMLSK